MALASSGRHLSALDMHGYGRGLHHLGTATLIVLAVARVRAPAERWLLRLWLLLRKHAHRSAFVSVFGRVNAVVGLHAQLVGLEAGVRPLVHCGTLRDLILLERRA